MPNASKKVANPNMRPTHVTRTLTPSAASSPPVQTPEDSKVISREEEGEEDNEEEADEHQDQEAGEDMEKRQRERRAAYMLYAKTIREEVYAANPGVPVVEIAAILAARWSEEPEETVARFVAMHREAAAEHERMMRAHEAAMDDEYEDEDEDDSSDGSGDED